MAVEPPRSHWRQACATRIPEAFTPSAVTGSGHQRSTWNTAAWPHPCPPMRWHLPSARPDRLTHGSDSIAGGPATALSLTHINNACAGSRPARLQAGNELKACRARPGCIGTLESERTCPRAAVPARLPLFLVFRTGQPSGVARSLLDPEGVGGPASSGCVRTHRQASPSSASRASKRGTHLGRAD